MENVKVVKEENPNVKKVAVLKCVKKSFTNDKGDNVTFNLYFVTINDKNVVLYPKQEDKKYFNLLVETYLKSKGE